MPSYRDIRTRHLVVDVGNTRIKWGLCGADSVARSVSLPPDEPDAWQRQIERWRLRSPLEWAVSGVHPPRRDLLCGWLQERGDTVRHFASANQLPVEVAVPQPAKVGIDRLLNAVAVNHRRNPKTPAFIIDAGSAITVDYVDRKGVFRGGAILPGLSLMAKSLHEQTALLPLIDVRPGFELPATSTVEAMNAGILFAAAGGINALIKRMAAVQRIGDNNEIHCGGGDAPMLSSLLPERTITWTHMSLEGLRIAAWPSESR